MVHQRHLQSSHRLPWTPIYNAPGSIYYASSGYNQLRPAGLPRGAGNDSSNDAYKSGPGIGSGQNRNFPLAAAASGTAYFTVRRSPSPPAHLRPRRPASTPGVISKLPDRTGYKRCRCHRHEAFAFPECDPREDAKFEIRADAFNLFNNLNFDPTRISNVITSTNFGQAQAA